MEPVTHTLAGIALGNALFRGRAGRAAVPILAIASNLPDIDAIVHVTGDPAAVLLRRTFGHSIFLLPIWCAALAWLLRRRWPQIRYGPMLGLIAVGAGVHLFFDLINSFGVVLLWPFSGVRPELAWVFIIDFVLTGLLAAPLLLAFAPALRGRITTTSRGALLAAGLYLAACGLLHAQAVRLLERTEGVPDRAVGAGGQAKVNAPAGDAGSEDGTLPDADWVEVEEEPAAATAPAKPDFLYAFPEPLGPHRWRGVARVQDSYHLYLLHPLSGRVERRGRVPTRVTDRRVIAARATPFGRRVESFFKAPVWEIAPDGRGASVWDLRFRTLVLEREAVFRFTIGDDRPSPATGGP